MRETTLGDLKDLLESEPASAGCVLFAACQDIVRLDARRRGIDAASADDVAQEAATRVLLRLRSGRPIPGAIALRAWVRGTVRNIASEQRRRRCRHRQALWSDLSANLIANRLSKLATKLATEREPADSEAVRPRRSADADWARSTLSRRVDGAASDPCQLLVLRAEGLSHAEIAARASLSVNAVRLRLRRIFRESRDRPPSLRP